ncbi:MAG TPA: DUF6152 family protein [Myxococcaceae bacterium]|nr:DUF6152 family protein [Myxococcaceae bacterium]
MTRASLHLAGLLFAAALAGALPALAHHSFAMFDFTKVITITGTVKEFQWTNPHVVLWVNVEGKDPKHPDVWWLEMTSPGNLTRTGWNRKALNAGDKVEVELNPLRDGKLGGALIKVTNSTTGQVFSTNLRDMEKPGLK